MTKFEPMLSASGEKVQIQFPCMVSPKIDGVRCFVHPDLGPVSRRLKSVPNPRWRSLLRDLPAGLDGEVMLPGRPCAEIAGRFNAKDSEPGDDEIIYHVFDFVDIGPEGSVNLKFCYRLEELSDVMHDCPPWVRFVDHYWVADEEQLQARYRWCLDQGYEGMMVRDPSGPYKFGRCGKMSPWLVKFKPFDDEEARILGVEEEMHNANEAEENELGRTKRSARREGLVPSGRLGKFRCAFLSDGKQFSVGSGIDQKSRVSWWEDRDSMPGRKVTVRFQSPRKEGEAPRHPVFVRFRDEDE